MFRKSFLTHVFTLKFQADDTAAMPSMFSKIPITHKSGRTTCTRAIIIVAPPQKGGVTQKGGVIRVATLSQPVVMIYLI